jgi:hypothetical protein
MKRSYMTRGEAWFAEMNIRSFVGSLGRSADRFSPSERPAGTNVNPSPSAAGNRELVSGKIPVAASHTLIVVHELEAARAHWTPTLFSGGPE